ncbi:MAG: hypothetical protein HQ594_06605 [Candidatus Omnitrophica bacterium]|nr:hypothetical protein [Candidatus Omnitrophota bacterium]
MKLKILLVFLFVFVVGVGLACGEENTSGDHIAVYYFHGNFRCNSCHKIENYTKETVDKYFNKEIRSGDIVYKIVNVEQKENVHFVEEYQLYTKSVVLSLVKDGKEIKYKNLTKVWEYLNSKTKFEDYEKKEIKEFLKEL